jgi:hypothetical protein
VFFFLWKFLNSGSDKKYGVLTRVVVNFGSSTENWALLQKPVKSQVTNWLFYLRMETIQGSL